MRLFTGLVLALSVTCGFAVNAETPRPVYVQFILGTDKACPQATNCREVGHKLTRKLSPVFRWKHFWEIDRRKVTLQPRKTTLEIAGDRKLEFSFTQTNEVEVRLYRRSGLVTKTRHTFGGPMSILGGEEESRESFFVVVRGDEPKGD